MSDTNSSTLCKLVTLGKIAPFNGTHGTMTFTFAPLLLIVGTTLDTALLDRITPMSNT
jgi:hypothetical protein